MKDDWHGRFVFYEKNDLTIESYIHSKNYYYSVDEKRLKEDPELEESFREYYRERSSSKSTEWSAVFPRELVFHTIKSF